MGSDDDTIIIRQKAVQAAEEIKAAGKKPVTLRVWVVVAIALSAFAAGAWLL